MAAEERAAIDRGDSANDTVAGFLAALAVFAGMLGLVWYPGRVGTAALLVALVAVALARSQQRFAALALVLTTLFWFLGMTIAVLANRPVF